MNIAILILLGLCLGSFVNALVWRLYKKRNFVNERSECVHCHHQLAWYDLVPVLSWLWLRGKCRYCHKPISWQYPAVELASAGLFVGSYLVWPLGLVSGPELILFGLWLVFVVGLVALAVYDIRHMLLPDVIVWPLVGLSVVFALVRYLGVDQLDAASAFREIILGMASVGGIYYLLYTVSKGAWVGFGDVKLGLFMGAVLGWQLGLLSLVLANFVGLIYIVPGLASGRLKRTSRIPFGPFLIVGFLIAGLWGSQLVDAYLQIILY